MRRTLLAVAALLACLPAYAGSLTLLGAGGPTVAAASYTGPGDVVASALTWWGLRAYSAATVSTAAANICNAADANCADVNSLANGNFDVATATGAPLNCGGAGGTCTVKTLYNKGSCGASCDLTQSTIASRPTLVLSCLGSLPCMATSGTQQLVSASAVTQSQPYTSVSIAETTNAGTSGSLFTWGNAGNSDGGAIYLAPSAGNPQLYCGSALHSAGTAVINTWYALEGVCNGGSSLLYVDGSTSGLGVTGSAGNTALASSGFFRMANDAFSDLAIGRYVEGGYWAGAFSGGQSSSMSSNVHGYWGF